MKPLFEQLLSDVRFVEGYHTCMNCGICTSVCPAAEFYNYDPRKLLNQLQDKSDESIIDLLKSETIWYCGQCMSCKTRCPRNNTPGFVIQALRKLSINLGYFVESEKGRQQFAIKRTVGDNILKFGYCVHPQGVAPELHPEQGPVWRWVVDNADDIMDRLGANYNKPGAGTLRKIAPEDLDELQAIFDVTGGTAMYESIENFSKEKAKLMHLDFNSDTPNEYFYEVYSENSNQHNKSHL